jgi:hypothetical protein
VAAGRLPSGLGGTGSAGIEAAGQIVAGTRAKERGMAYELNCKACGQLFSNQDKEQLAREVEEHNRKMHGEQRLDRQAFEERVRQTD